MIVNRIEECFKQLRAEKKPAFIPYITGGDPSLEMTEKIVLSLEEAGADIVEFGVPFSDPVGDGVVIQEAAQRALAGGANLDKIFESIGRIRKVCDIPILLFSYFNPILVYGVERFAESAAKAGADGVLCVDLPPEEADEYKAALGKAGMCAVFLTAPTSSDERLAMIADQCTGFIYYVSQLGVTGERSDLAADLKESVARIKKYTGKPVAVGFGISKPEHAREVAGLADGVVVGSAIVRLIAGCEGGRETPEKVRQFVRGLVEATKGL
jgi:tryptophan synthase alpha chain